MKREDLIYAIEEEASYQKLINVLRTVVDAHKPQQRCYDATCYCVDMCSKCKEDYPCSDIQAIEKALV